MNPIQSVRIAILAALVAASGVTPSASAPARPVPKGTHLVKPAPPPPPRPAATLRIVNGHYFSYALPQGWRVGEDGQFALTLTAPDNKALTVMVGNAGLPPNYPPAQFA